MPKTPAQNPLVRKVGPLPVWAWAALALAAWFLFLRSPQAAGGGALPYTPAGSGSAAQQPSSGQGSATSNMSDALLAALQQQGSSTDALIQAVQSTSPTGASGNSDSGTVGAVNNAPVSSFAQPLEPAPVATFDPALSVASQTYYVVPSASPAEAPIYFQPTGYFQNEQGYGTVTTPPQLAPGQIPTAGKAYAE